MTETVESRAVTIAARVMQAAGLCLCDGCIRAWLLDKAREALEREGLQDA